MVKKKNNSSNASMYISAVIPLIVMAVVTPTIVRQIPAEAWMQVWKLVVAFANTWYGVALILLLSIPVLAAIVYIPVKLFMLLTKYFEKAQW